MNQVAVGTIFALSLFVGMFILMECGRWLGAHRAKQDEESARPGLGAIEGAVFALLGLLIAFTFTGAASRFDHRRDLIAQEVNAIGTAWLRLDLVEPVARAELQDLFRQYLDARLEAYRLIREPERAKERYQQSVALQGQIWSKAVAAGQSQASNPIRIVLLPALNEMFDIASLRLMTMRMHPPAVVFALLGTLVLLSALMSGFSMSRGRRSWTHIIAFAAIMAGSVYLIIDLEHPRLGLIRVESFDQSLIDLRHSMDVK